MVNCVIRLDVPDWKIGQNATVYFTDTMRTTGVCELNEAEAEMEGGGSTWFFVCGECHTAIDSKDKYCRECGRKIIWT
jgi:hypothetical protein